MVLDPMACKICSDKKSASSKVDYAKRTYNTIHALLVNSKEEGYEPEIDQGVLHRAGVHPSTLCHVSQRAMCGHCSKISSNMSEANRYGQMLANDIIELFFILREMKEAEDDNYGIIKNKIMRLVGGHYPKAAYFIGRMT